MLTSHETERDFAHFFDGLQKLAVLLGYQLCPRFMMQDTCHASLNAFSKVLELSSLSMNKTKSQKKQQKRFQHAISRKYAGRRVCNAHLTSMHSSQALTIQIAPVAAAAAAQDSRNGRFVTYSTIFKEALYDEKYDQPEKFVKK